VISTRWLGETVFQTAWLGELNNTSIFLAGRAENISTLMQTVAGRNLRKEPHGNINTKMEHL